MSTHRRCQIMGIVNVTTDSFSDGGRYLDHGAAIEHAHQLIDEGADILDIGGESTRPGAQRVSAEVELARVVPVVRQLAAEGHVVSVDTMRASVARACVDAGAKIINDVSGGLADPAMFATMAETGVDVCLMHWQTERFGNAAGAAHTPGRVVGDVATGLRQLVDAATQAGVSHERIILDPGLGFAKTADDNWALLRDLDGLVDSGFRILIGASRKRFLQAIRTDVNPLSQPSPMGADAATVAVSTLSALAGAWAVRVHEVAANRDAVEVVARMRAHHGSQQRAGGTDG